MSESREPLIWLDMEMTGLDPETNVPVEVAVIVTDPELRELDSFEAVIWQPEKLLLEMQPIVRKMHTENGLLTKIRNSPFSVLDVERKMMQLLARWVKPGEGVLSGNSIHQDRRFIAKYFPVVNGYLHYRMVDVSTVKELVKRWYGPDRLPEKAASDHTALSDVRASIRELEHYRRAVFQPSSDGAADSNERKG
ncbi:MAG: oligoribonuclease [Myxococcota bacterium]